MTRRKYWPFHGLFGRLIVSYFLVTLLAAIVIEAAVTLGPIINAANNQDNSVPLPQALSIRSAPGIATMLIKHPASADDGTSQQYLIWVLDLVNARAICTHAAVAVLNTQGNIIDAISEVVYHDSARTTVIGSTVDAQTLFATPSAQERIQAVLRGDDAPSAVMNTSPNGFTTIAVPLVYPTKVGGPFVGVLAVTFDGPMLTIVAPSHDLSYYVGQVMQNLQIDGLYIVLLGIVIGTLVGAFISRNLTRRLRRITAVADAWSQGDLNATVSDQARDELGQLAQDLNHMAGQIQGLLTTRQALAVVEERNRLARDLHDSVKQHVFANALLINASRHLLEQDQVAQVRVHLEEAEQLAQQAQEELTILIQSLRPAALADRGLVEVSEEYVQEWSARTGIRAQLRVTGMRAMALDIEEALFRVTQEALANVARHSGARNVSIDLTWEPDHILLEVTDDGGGFNVQSKLAGVGLSSMRERVMAQAGTLSITSSDAGTSVKAVIPLAASKAPGEVLA